MGKKRKIFGDSPIFANLGPILTLALPLMGNRLVLNLLGSAEAILIPSRLIDYGLTHDQSQFITEIQIPLNPDCPGIIA